MLVREEPINIKRKYTVIVRTVILLFITILTITVYLRFVLLNKVGFSHIYICTWIHVMVRSKQESMITVRWIHE